MKRFASYGSPDAGRDGTFVSSAVASCLLRNISMQRWKSVWTGKCRASLLGSSLGCWQEITNLVLFDWHWCHVAFLGT